MKLGLPAVVFLYLSFYTPQVSGQSSPSDSLLRQSAYDHSAAVYQSQLGDQSALNNGTRYEKYPHPFRLGTAYYPFDNFAPGSVVYDGIPFDSVLLLFDALQQTVIALKDGYSLQLISEKVKSFTIKEHVFMRLTADSSRNGITNTGFYEIIYRGNSSVIKEIRKSIHEETFNTDGTPFYMVSDEIYYVRRKSVYVPVKLMGNLPAIFSDHKKEIKKYIDKNNLLATDKENMLILVAAYYDQLVQ